MTVTTHGQRFILAPWKQGNNLLTMTFRFMHTADIHLDSPLKSLALRNQELADVVANATRQVLVRIVDLCLLEKVDALLIAGDLYDGDQTSMKTARFLALQLRRLCDAQISVYLIRGNHDAESKITRELTLPNRVHVFSSKAEAVLFTPPEGAHAEQQQSVVIHGMSFKKPHAPASLLPDFKQATPQAINIGMMHTSLDGSAQHDLYAPCSLVDLQQHGFNYWALGHIHKRAVHSTEQCTVVMPGIPQGRDIGESGAKSVTLVTVNDDNSISTDEHLLAIAQFEEIAIELDDSFEWPSAIDLVIDRIEHTANNCNADHLVARIVVNGHTNLAWRLRRDTDLFTNEIEARLEVAEHLWLDKIIIHCEPPVDKLINTGPQAELVNLIADQIEHSAILREDAKQTIKDILKSLPGELRSTFGDNDEQLSATIKSLALQGSKQIAAQLQGDATPEDSVRK